VRHECGSGDAAGSAGLRARSFTLYATNGEVIWRIVVEAVLDLFLFALEGLAKGANASRR
jgi:hypothetical protein